MRTTKLPETQPLLWKMALSIKDQTIPFSALMLWVLQGLLAKSQLADQEQPCGVGDE